jgi:hypothetical protein
MSSLFQGIYDEAKEKAAKHFLCRLLGHRWISCFDSEGFRYEEYCPRCKTTQPATMVRL